MPKLLKKNILQQSEDISRTLKTKSTNTKHLSFYKKVNDLDISRIGLAIPKKNAKRAVDRNRIKRLIREIFRNTLIEQPTDIVVKLHVPIGKKTKKKLRESERKQIRQELIDHFLIK
jgi:ribonuclease P protein component